MKKYSLIEFICSLTLLLLPALYGFSVSSRLPQVMSSRFDLAGNVTTYMDKHLFLILIPLFMLAAQLLVFGASIAKPLLNKNFELLIRWIIPLINLIIYPATIYRNLHQGFPMTKLAFLSIGLLLVVLGNYLPKKVQADREPLPRKLAYAVMGAGLVLFAAGLFI
ncbi:putative membrane protein [Streptococcus sp. DD11]|uniref:DUF1648 domain-containing protein n=1 Tax=Streptococcus sp. DD11 TaxID=1777879 RepID=UPI000794C307|nr:DUF1648 domain-containing protein [Streptococcus sp. DD11]KXT82670.1 putative membrane protein [Streptococcus sp. DD11]